MKLQTVLSAYLIVLLGTQTASAQLKVDFNSLTQGGGPNPEAGFESYDAGHEIASDFVPMTYSIDFGSGPVNVTVTPQWPNTTDNRVMQSIDRAAGFDANWVGDRIDLLTDWIGSDSRSASGGNGDWDRVSGTPTYFTLTLSGLPACAFDWLSYHHDTELVWSDFQVEVSTDGGLTFGPVVDMEMTSSSPGGIPPDPFKETGSPDPDPRNLSSTFMTTFVADGSADVVLRFAPFVDGVDGIGVHKQLFGLNAFELDCAIGSSYCIGAPNSVGAGAHMSATGSASVTANDLVLYSMPVPDQPGIFFYGANQVQVPFGHGFLCISSPLHLLYPPVVGLLNQAVQVLDHASLPAGGQISVGSTWNFQHWYRDPAFGMPAFNASNGLSITFTP